MASRPGSEQCGLEAVPGESQAAPATTGTGGRSAGREKRGALAQVARHGGAGATGQGVLSDADAAWRRSRGSG